MGCNHGIKSLPLSYPKASTKGRGGSGRSGQWLRCRQTVPDITTRHRGVPGHVLAVAMGRETLGMKECHMLMREGGECFIIVTVGLYVGSCRDRQAPTPPWAGRGETKVWVSSPRLTVCEASASSPRGVSAEWEERGGGKGGEVERREGGEWGWGQLCGQHRGCPVV